LDKNRQISRSRHLYGAGRDWVGDRHRLRRVQGGAGGYETAVGESPAIFSLVVAVVLLFTKTEDLVFLHIPALLGAGLCMGLGAVGCGMGEGFVAGEACDGVSKAPENAGLITRTMLIGQAVSESTAIYSLVVAILLIYVAV
jgi:F-type H+-transporting ATPase subunit c